MKTQTILKTLSVLSCAGLAACGGIGARYADWYDPTTAIESGPIDVAVIGAPAAGVAPAVLTSAVTDALRRRGIQPGQQTMAGAYDPNFRVIVLVGPAAGRAAEAGNADRDVGLCKMLNGPAVAALSESGTSAGGATPALAVLCWQNSFQSLAYVESAGADEPALRSNLASLIDQVFPVVNWEAYTRANQG